LKRLEGNINYSLVKIRYDNFDTHTLQKNIAYTLMDHVMIAMACLIIIIIIFSKNKGGCFTLSQKYLTKMVF